MTSGNGIFRNGLNGHGSRTCTPKTRKLWEIVKGRVKRKADFYQDKRLKGNRFSRQPASTCENKANALLHQKRGLPGMPVTDVDVAGLNVVVENLKRISCAGLRRPKPRQHEYALIIIGGFFLTRVASGEKRSLRRLCL